MAKRKETTSFYQGSHSFQEDDQIVTIHSTNIYHLLLGVILLMPISLLATIPFTILIEDISFLDAISRAVNSSYAMFEALLTLGWAFAIMAIILATQKRVQFSQSLQAICHEELEMNKRIIDKIDLSDIKAILIPRQRPILPPPAKILTDKEEFPIEIRRLWRTNLDHIRKLADRAELPLIEE